MAKGKVVRIASNKIFGFIRPDDGGGDVYFKVQWVKDAPSSGVQEGLQVEYETRETSQGLQTSWVRAIARVETASQVHDSAPKQHEPAEAMPGQQSRAAYRFLNPYNFVRYLDEPSAQVIDKHPETQLLVRCQPPPHDRYLSLTGRITCTVEAVTPLFVSDSHAITPDAQYPDHMIYRFFQVKNEKGELEPAIPASSLRGMIRSVFEAATNSCFSVFESRRLSYRLEAGKAAGLVPARVEKRKDGTLHLHLLPGLAPLSPGQRPKALYAATVHLYDPIDPKLDKSKIRKVSLDGFKHGDPCYALVEKKGIFTYVQKVGHTAQELPRPDRDSQRIVEGWLCINNQNVENKRKERFFFRASDNTIGPNYIPLPPAVKDAYEALIDDYQTRHRDAIKARRDAGQQPGERVPAKRHDEQDEPAFSRYMYRKEDLELGDRTLVYAGLSGTLTNPRVEYIVPAAVPRVSYDYSIADLLPEHLHPCNSYETLCPACRTFGWVYATQSDRQLPTDKITAFAGRLRFSHAALVDNQGVLDDITLAILSSPKPTTTRFYLRPSTGEPRDGLSDAEAGYDGDNVLRGRKVYRHHVTANPIEYTRATNETHDGRDDQNRTVRGALRPGAQFTFTLEFENLASLELGALLWAMEMEEGMYHRLGFAKPLGFGSVRLRIMSLELMNPSGRYESLSITGGWEDQLARKSAWIEQFKQAMAVLYDQPFAKLPNVRDLLALLGQSAELPIHYPRSSRSPDPQGKNFEWFVGNNRKYGPKVTLALPGEDTEGLPLIDQKGNVR